MHIAGGIYWEHCCIPEWDALFGSGGRAAAAVSNLSPSTVLHTYSEESTNLVLLEKLGVEIFSHSRNSAISFTYFHPLSKPHIEPALDRIAPRPPIKVSSDVVLRFGILEGDAIVDAQRAIYDPQTWRNPAPFGENGSVAKELAIVLNEYELKCATGEEDLRSAAQQIIETHGASVVVAKGGVKGATVFEDNGKCNSVPAYRSTRVFKIGTGDIFSAIFAHHWGEERLSAVNAADIASRSVAAYCNSTRLPLKDDEPGLMEPINFVSSGCVLLDGEIETIGQRYTMEEARFVLNDLGVPVNCPALGYTSEIKETAVLLIDDGMEHRFTDRMSSAMADGTPIVALKKKSTDCHGQIPNYSKLTVIDDFASALYFASWAAAENGRL
jgi:hypothetical protein